MGAAFIVLIVCVIGFIFSLRYQSKRNEEIISEHQLFIEKFETVLKEKVGKRLNKELYSIKNDVALALDEENKRIYLYKSGYINGLLKSYLYEDILQVEIIEDNITISKTSRSSQIGKALLGGVLAGGVGAVIGGLSGNVYSSDNVRNMDIRILINDTDHPEYIFNVLNNVNIHGQEIKKGISRGDIIYQFSKEKANYWQSLLSVLISQADKNKVVPNQGKETLLVADEIRRLKELMDQNLISKEEFKEQRRKLLL